MPHVLGDCWLGDRSTIASTWGSSRRVGTTASNQNGQVSWQLMVPAAMSPDMTPTHSRRQMKVTTPGADKSAPPHTATTAARGAISPGGREGIIRLGPHGSVYM